VHGWAARYSAGLTSTSSTYENDPVRPTPVLPEDRTLAGPFLRYELIEDFYEKVENRNQIGRPEYFAMGFRSQLQLGRTLEALDSTEESWVYSVNASKGFGSIHNLALLLSGAYSGRLHEATRRNQLPAAPRASTGRSQARRSSAQPSAATCTGDRTRRRRSSSAATPACAAIR
jgi:hypothetical protein